MRKTILTITAAASIAAVPSVALAGLGPPGPAFYVNGTIIERSGRRRRSPEPAHRRTRSTRSTSSPAPR